MDKALNWPRLESLIKNELGQKNTDALGKYSFATGKGE
jgi:hypothetical protein